MTKKVLFFLLLLPFLSKAQDKHDSYNIYSQYLEQFKAEKQGHADFIIRASIYRDTLSNGYITEIVDDLRAFLKGEYSALLACRCNSFAPVLKRDTLWIPVIAEIGNKLEKVSTLTNNFSPDLHAMIITDDAYKEFFKDRKHIEKNWVNFHRRYPIPAFLIEFSKIATDGKHAAFYFASRCGGLCGHGCVVLFYKDGSNWKFLQTLSIWDS